MGIGNNNRYYSVAGGLPNCTTYVWVRCEEEGLPQPANGNAQNWPFNLCPGGEVVYHGNGGSAPIRYGDVVVAPSQHHVCFVNSDGTVSGSGYMSNNYLDEDYKVESPGMTERGNKSFGLSVKNNGGFGNDGHHNGNLTRGTYRPGSSYKYKSTAYYFYHKNSLSLEGGCSGDIYVLRCTSSSPSGGGGGDSSDSGDGDGGGDSGQESGGDAPGWYPESGSIQETECGQQPLGVGDIYNSGTQDNPRLPSVYTNDAEHKEDGWGQNLTTHTYERVYIFNPDGTGQGSDGVETKRFSRPYGEQDEPVAPGVDEKNEGGVLDGE